MPSENTRSEHVRVLVSLARAFGGALLFALPMLMTAEMWELGATMPPFRIALLMTLMLPLLVLLSYFAGFEATFSIKEDMVDALVAYAAGFGTGGVLLIMLGIIGPGTSLGVAVGSISLQAVPGSIGAMLAHSQLSAHADNDDEVERSTPTPGYGGILFLMLVGALFFAFNLAPTEEVVQVAYRITSWHAVLMLVVSLSLMHAFVYAVQFRGEAELPSDTPWWSAFARFTVPGYAIALLISLYMLWTFGRLEGLSLSAAIIATMVLSLPAAVGAAAARLIL